MGRDILDFNNYQLTVIIENIVRHHLSLYDEDFEAYIKGKWLTHTNGYNHLPLSLIFFLRIFHIRHPRFSKHHF